MHPSKFDQLSSCILVCVNPSKYDAREFEGAGCNHGDEGVQAQQKGAHLECLNAYCAEFIEYHVFVGMLLLFLFILAHLITPLFSFNEALDLMKCYTTNDGK